MDTWKLEICETAFTPKEAASLLAMREDEFNTRVTAGIFWPDDYGGFTVRALIKSVLFSSLTTTKTPVDKIASISTYSAKAAIFYALERRPRLVVVRLRDGGGTSKFSTCMAPPHVLLAGLSSPPVNRYMHITTDRAWASRLPEAGEARVVDLMVVGNRIADRARRQIVTAHYEYYDVDELGPLPTRHLAESATI
jgi:hypothetical protein